MQTQDPAILLDFTIPFDDNKLFLLEKVISVMYSGSSQDVSFILLQKLTLLFNANILTNKL